MESLEAALMPAEGILRSTPSPEKPPDELGFSFELIPFLHFIASLIDLFGFRRRTSL